METKDLFNISVIKELLERNSFKFSKSLGQNFLTEHRVVEKLCEGCGVNRDTCVLEIGPGIGALTRELGDRAARVVSIELDKTLFPILGETLAGYDNISLVQGDILRSDIDKIIPGEFAGKDIYVCANLPYYITTPVLQKLFESGRFKKICVMLQKEVSRRICAEAGSPEYSSFTVFTQYYAKPEILFDVPAGCFIPRPKVDSAVLLFNMRGAKPEEVKDEKLFFKVLRSAFEQRRKMLINGLTRNFGDKLSKAELAGIVEQCGLRPDIRGERLDFHQFAKMTELISNKLVCNDE